MRRSFTRSATEEERLSERKDRTPRMPNNAELEEIEGKNEKNLKRTRMRRTDVNVMDEFERPEGQRFREENP